MLVDLQISNFALIAEQRISFGAGLNVISGESGVGKSLVLAALQFVMGAKARAEAVRAGAESAEVQAAFSLQSLGAERQAVLAKIGLPDIARADELVLARSLSSQGKSRVYINGKLGTVALLEEISAALVNFCGQHQHIQLLEHRFHLQLIDNYAGNKSLLQQYREAQHLWKRERARLDELHESESKLGARQEQLKEIVAELEPLNLTGDLREKLEQQVKTLGAAERILEQGAQALALLSSDAPLTREFQQCLSFLAELSKADPDAQDFCSRLQTLKLECRELGSDIERYLGGISIDDQALNRDRERLAELARILRKYKTDCTGLLKILADSKHELKLSSDIQARSQLAAEVLRLGKERDELASRLRTSRKGAISKLLSDVPGDFKDLGMKEVRFEVRCREIEAGPNGSDDIEILFSANKGHPLRPLKEIASGGELSRVTLVLKKNLRDSTGVNVLVFDEVDSGISGGVARAVGEKLKELSSYSQVICITHLPQIASLADHHFLVGKSGGKQTSSIIREISHNERVEEIARMLAGYQVTRAARESARELLSSKTE